MKQVSIELDIDQWEKVDNCLSKQPLYNELLYTADFTSVVEVKKLIKRVLWRG